jgi:hypothetical protein
VYKKFIFCKVTVNKQQHRYIGIHKKAIIIHVVNGLAFSMVTVFEDFSLNIKQIWVTNMFISMLSTYLYNMGARCWWWMPFWPPFLMACEQFIENTSSGRIRFSKRLFNCFIQNQAKEFLPNTFQRGFPCPIGRIQRYHAIGGENGTTMVVMIVG